MSESGQVIRTCIGCRQRHERSALIRLLALGDPPRLQLDPRGRLDGRGAWLHPDEGCLDRALARRAIPRALRRSDVVVDEEFANAFRTLTKAGQKMMDDK